MSAFQSLPLTVSLADAIRNEFTKLKDRESMIKQMFLSTLKQDAVKAENDSTTTPPGGDFHDRLQDRYECIVSNGLDVAFTEAKNNILSKMTQNGYCQRITHKNNPQ